MSSKPVVFFFDVDNTLLDNDRIIDDLRHYLELEVGQEHSEHYWKIFEQLRTELGYADYLGALQRYRVEHPNDPKLPTVSYFLLNYPFANRLYPNSLDVIEHCRQLGQVVILSDGDAVFQPRKVERSGIFEAVEGNVLIYIHKELELDDVVLRYPAEHYVMVDDKLRILGDIKKAWGERVTTVFPRQWHYALDLEILAKYPSADINIERIGDLIEYDLPSLLQAGRQSAKPAVGLLSNGSYTVMVTKSGGGYSMRKGMAVTRWREDSVRDSWGGFCYLRDVQSGAVWSTGFQPTLCAGRDYEVLFAEDRIEIRRFDAGIRTRTEIIVSTEDDAELRRTMLTNESLHPREIEITSYAEIVLNTAAADAAHPAFSNLSIETEFIPEANALLARRRSRSEKEREVWGVHLMVVEGETIGATQYETDRALFLGRGRAPRNASAIAEDRPLSNTVGAVLDPVWSLRARARIEPGATAHVTFTTAIADSREAALALADKYHAASVFEPAASQARTRAQVELSRLQVDVEDARLYQRLAGLLIYLHPALRPRPQVLQLNEKTQSALWAYGISGDLPILVVRIADARDLPLVGQALHAHEYLRAKRFAFDLVILNDRPPPDAQSLQEALLDLVWTSNHLPSLDKSGGVFLRRSDSLPDADRILLHTVARAVFVTERGTLEEQLERPIVEPELPPTFVPRWSSRRYAEPTTPALDLEHFNGLGGFTPDGREYVITLGEGQWTPAPWLNVIANEKEFGFQISESGAGFTWSVNSRENRLTPWTNDAVSDAPGEVIYLRDEDTGSLWTPTPLPIREAAPYTIRHGRGYTAFEHTSHGIGQELLAFAPVDAPVKISRLRLRNLTERARRLSVTSYHELVLGVAREASAPFVVTEVDRSTGAIFARNSYNNEFAGRVAFAAVHGAAVGDQTVTCDRREFLGSNGTVARPAALSRERLSGRAGAGLDPCAGIRCEIELAPGESRDLFVLFGEAETREAAQSIVTRFEDAGAAEEALLRVVAHWDNLLGAIEVKTPDASMNRMMNGWLLYQTLVCRFWSRSAFYQSGGAFGFRDQLQDVMALVYARPGLTRGHILRAAARQFKEGDVQHWWHTPTGRGVRTRISDDLLWLPYVTSFYIEKTNDRAVLDESISFIEAPLLNEGEDEAYTQPAVSAEQASLYEHCVRAIDRSLAVGVHGLPLMGSGDWNDGMNRVGREGKGESVWLAWFLYRVLMDFAPLCEARGDAERATRYRAHAEKIRSALEETAWDGDWYVRAFFDDGTPLGSASSDECRIDSIAQSWGVISGAANPERAARALASVEQHLVRRADGLVMLFTPPFDKSPLDPGYIKGYVPGVRENGGQYTHGAVWTVIAYALLGDGDRAGELFALLNPVNHAATRAGLHKYKVEPYVVAGDVYSNSQHTGRGGWTWYTGSAAWMYRAGLESLLGFELRGESLRFNPCIPRDWREYEITYRHGKTSYRITVENPGGVSRGVAAVELDGAPQAEFEIKLVDDGREHVVRVVLGSLEGKR
jgi:cyclic beta-1,2-glucan synthetase